MKHILNEETRYRVFCLLHDNPYMSQRKLADAMGVSLGKMNYCIKALVDVGHVKFCNFAHSKKKTGYMYILTPKGVAEKLQVTLQFLDIKKKQYDQIQKEIVVLQKQVRETIK